MVTRGNHTRVGSDYSADYLTKPLSTHTGVPLYNHVCANNNFRSVNLHVL